MMNERMRPSSSSSSFEESDVSVCDDFLRARRRTRGRGSFHEKLNEFINAFVRYTDSGELFQKKSDDDDDDDDDDSSSSSSFVSGTFWIEKKALDDPANAIERYCATLANRCALVKKKTDESFAGCEFWIQDVCSDELPKAYHTDCDQPRFDENAGEFVKNHPLVSTVFYATDLGGATVVFDDSLKSTKRAVVSPKVNRVLAFRGDLVHGVCKGPLYDENGCLYQRVTLLVNFWEKDKRPRCARDLPKDLFPDDDDEDFKEDLDEDDSASAATRAVLRLKHITLNSQQNYDLEWSNQEVPLEVFKTIHDDYAQKNDDDGYSLLVEYV